MKRSKRFLSILLAALVLVTTVASTTVISASAAAIDNSALCSEYYATNPNAQVGQQATITIDGSFSDWSADMLIAKGAAWDVANHYKGGHENCVLDTIALFGAWDNDNLYIAWQMVNTTDTWQREGDASLSDGGRVLDVPLILALSVDPSSPSMTNKIAGGNNIWDMKAGVEFTTHVDHLFYMSGKPGLGEPAMFTAVDESGNTNYTTGCKNFSAAGISYNMAEGNVCDSIWGLNYSQDPSDVTSAEADWVDYAEFKGQMGTHNTKYDSFYEIKIPLSALGIDANYLTTNGIGAMVVATRGESGIDCIPFDTTMLDNALDDYGSDPSTSHEKDDVDNITVSFASVGKLGDGTIIPTPKPTTPVEIPTTVPDVTPTTAEPSETTASTPADSQPSSTPIIVPPVVSNPTETTPTESTTASVIPVPTLDIEDPGTTAPTETATAKPSVPVINDGALLGDADLNGTVNIKDATLIQKHLAKITTLDETAQLVSDVDANEVINIRDVTFIQKWLAKMEVEYAIGEPVNTGEIIVPTTTPVESTNTPVVVPPTTATQTLTTEPTEPAVSTTATEPTKATDATEPSEIPTQTQPIITEPITQPIITEPVSQPSDGTETIYFVDGTPEGWIGDADAKIYIFNYETNENYLGTMQDENTWAFQVPAGMSAINFYRCEGEFTQTAWNTWTMCVTARGSENTFTVTANEAGSWTGTSSGGNGFVPPVDNPPVDNPPVDNPTGDYIYFTDNAGWGTVYCHTWNLSGGTNTPWPGDQMENIGDNQYRLLVDGSHTHLKFNGGDGGPESNEFELVLGNTYSN